MLAFFRLTALCDLVEFRETESSAYPGLALQHKDRALTPDPDSARFPSSHCTLFKKGGVSGEIY